MLTQLYTSASGLIAGERKVELISNNLANVNTPAYRADRPLFSSYFTDAVAAASGGNTPASPQSVALAGRWYEEAQGALRSTGNPFDLALRGDGWFRVQTQAGERLTRGGSFAVDAEGRLTTAEGAAVLDDRGMEIILAPDEALSGEFSVNPEGMISVDGGQVATLGLVKADLRNLEREGAGLWRPIGPVVEMEPGSTEVAQGYIEQSAVEATSELVNLISAQRLFEMHQKLVDVGFNNVARKAVELGRPR